MIKLNYQDRETNEKLINSYPKMHFLARGNALDETDEEVISGFKYMADHGTFVEDVTGALLELNKVLEENNPELLQQISFFIFNRGNLGYEHSFNFLTKLYQSLDYYQKSKLESRYSNLSGIAYKYIKNYFDGRENSINQFYILGDKNPISIAGLKEAVTELGEIIDQNDSALFIDVMKYIFEKSFKDEEDIKAYILGMYKALKYCLDKQDSFTAKKDTVLDRITKFITKHNAK